MAEININTTQNVTLSYEVAGLGERILAYIIDSFIVWAYVIAAWLLLFQTDFVNTDYGWVIIPIGLIPAFCYHLVSEIFFNGQSIGKKQVKIKVVKLDGSKPTIVGFILRWVLRPVDLGIYGVVAILCIALGGKGQRLGDMVAGTTVIKTNRKNSFYKNPMDVVKELEGYEVIYQEAINLNDRDIQIMKEALKVYRDSGNVAPVEATARKAEEILNVRSNQPAVKFLNTLIKDYNYLVNMEMD